jgi:saccharopine dehydrogenase-like NADP-dependent oxidoreductase
MVSVAILGDGRIARAVQIVLEEAGVGQGTLVDSFADLESYEILVGALAGGLGPVALDRALASRIDLVDLTDLEPGVYEAREAEIEAAGIAVYPGAGFCPGLVNLILGRELADRGVDSIEVIAGSLSPTPNYFPFLWCFEDMVLEFGGESLQIIDGEERLCGAFAGQRPESFLGIESESYFCQSGFENLARRAGVRQFTYRNLRPAGFRTFFEFLRAHGAFDAEVLPATKALLERRVDDNASLAEITVSGAVKRSWTISTRAAAGATLNSMQRLTVACATAFVARAAAMRKTRRPGLHWCEAIGADEAAFASLTGEIQRLGVVIERKATAA